MNDPEVALCFWLFANKGITPGQFYAMPTGEQLLIRAFVNQLLDEKPKVWRSKKNGS